jgi:CPA2 family monovalent cation:H+ antiporter-2
VSQSLLELGVILAVLFAGGLIASRLRQSVIPAYILGGILLHNFVTNVELIHLLSTIGLMLLLFFIGLEFSTSYLRHHVRPITRAGIDPRSTSSRAVHRAGMGSARLRLPSDRYISSSAVVTKAMIDNRQAANPEADTIVGILVFEDLAIVLILALLTGFQSGSVEAASLSWTLLKIALFITPFLLLPPSVIPRLNRLLHVESTELFLLMALAVVLLASALSTRLGFSEAVGAFLVGLLFSETAHRQRIIDRLAPFRDLRGDLLPLLRPDDPWEGWSGTSSRSQGWSSWA